MIGITNIYLKIMCDEIIVHIEDSCISNEATCYRMRELCFIVQLENELNTGL
jgi:hypothetical protein